MRSRPALTLTLLILISAPAQAQAPSEAEFEAAVATARSRGASDGLEVRTDGMAMAQWRAGLPLAAWRIGRHCHVGYSPWLAAQRFAWLFPSMPAADRTLWLGGLVAHELAHCRHSENAAAAGPAASVAQEAAADLAFALHVDQPGEGGLALIERLASMRQARSKLDPGHDTHAALQCYLAQRKDEPADRPRTLEEWQARCVDQLFWPS